jgi:hypothetical protein
MQACKKCYSILVLGDIHLKSIYIYIVFHSFCQPARSKNCRNLDSSWIQMLTSARSQNVSLSSCPLQYAWTRSTEPIHLEVPTLHTPYSPMTKFNSSASSCGMYMYSAFRLDIFVVQSIINLWWTSSLRFVWELTLICVVDVWTMNHQGQIILLLCSNFEPKYFGRVCPVCLFVSKEQPELLLVYK